MSSISGHVEAECGERQPRPGKCLFGEAVVVRDADRVVRLTGPGERGVDDMTHTGLDGRVDGVRLELRPLGARVETDDQQGVGTVECRHERTGIAEVRRAHLDRQARGLLRRAGRPHDLGGRYALDEVADGQLCEPAGHSGDDDHSVLPTGVRLVCDACVHLGRGRERRGEGT
ncbi:hypothetical protein [Streptomyces sp. M3]|uniref:hypothetical protein n=1 Tax=Streptomyces sp. M3 TaxID=295102 RepID=UPI001F5072A9|nr:hypothetical protein [Streptomyces sp. M3]